MSNPHRALKTTFDRRDLIAKYGHPHQFRDTIYNAYQNAAISKDTMFGMAEVYKELWQRTEDNRTLDLREATSIVAANS